MKKLFLLAIFVNISFLFSESLLLGGRFYIHHPEGLELKLEPNPNSQSLLNLPFGSRVELEKELETATTIQENIPGNWRATSTKKGSGYVLDAFLSRYSPPPVNCDSLQMYMDETYKRHKNTYQDNKDIRSIITHYVGGNKHIVSKLNRMRIFQLELKNASLKDGFFIGRACAHPAFRGMSFLPKGKTIEWEVEGGKHGEKHKLKIVEEEKLTIITHSFIPFANKEGKNR
jgi:hypothetical protein